jgi:uncharacterized protein involved in exopolysaccharide biosynthesis
MAAEAGDAQYKINLITFRELLKRVVDELQRLDKDKDNTFKLVNQTYESEDGLPLAGCPRETIDAIFDAYETLERVIGILDNPEDYVKKNIKTQQDVQAVLTDMTYASLKPYNLKRYLNADKIAALNGLDENNDGELLKLTNEFQQMKETTSWGGEITIRVEAAIKPHIAPDLPDAPEDEVLGSSRRF